MGIITRSIDRLPGWVQAILFALAAIGGVYYIAEYGFWRFLLRMLFSPDL
jgi:hypothetical protein